MVYADSKVVQIMVRIKPIQDPYYVMEFEFEIEYYSLIRKDGFVLNNPNYFNVFNFIYIN